MKRRAPPLALLVALVAFVFAQLMGAVHACDIGLGAQSPAHMVSVHDNVDCCGDTATVPDPNCDNHCRLGDKAPDRAQTTSPHLVASGFAMPVAVAQPIHSQASLPWAPHLARHIEPPISVRNCCFRI